GRLAAELLQALGELGCAPESYAILDVSGELRQRQHQTLRDLAPTWLPRVRWLDAWPTTWQGVMVGNEVLDAMPVERFAITPQGPRPWLVDYDVERRGFVWRLGAEDPAVSEAVAAIESGLAEPLPLDYTSEYCPTLKPWLASAAEVLTRGMMLLVDYGYSRREYYHPERREGTLVCHYRHRVHDDPFCWPGLQDISANVDFTAVAEAAVAAGLEVAGYTRQGWFLLNCGLEGVLAAAEALATTDAQRLALRQQVAQLTLPTEMGERFKVVALSKDLAEPLVGFARGDDRHRL
ncbi:MAG: class I SAM-dependent methyltransferase, partial [Candidatus Competibacterales bacterium]